MLFTTETKANTHRHVYISILLSLHHTVYTCVKLKDSSVQLHIELSGINIQRLSYIYTRENRQPASSTANSAVIDRFLNYSTLSGEYLKCREHTQHALLVSQTLHRERERETSPLS